MDISLYFQPSGRFGHSRPEWLAHSLGDNTLFHTVSGMPQLDGAQVAPLGDLEAPALAQQHVAHRHAHVVKAICLC